MRASIFAVMTFLACGGGKGGGTGDPGVAVVELSTDAQVNLCEQFLDDLCGGTIDPELEDFCSDPCIEISCQPAATNGHIDAECDLGPDGTPILTGDVEDCGASGELSICGQGGGCMFDALEAACSGA
jgi:hypothetical protein